VSPFLLLAVTARLGRVCAAGVPLADERTGNRRARISSIDALIKTADEALYRAKFLGGNQVSLATPTPAPHHDVAAE
jgi:GGDEF domain-containing protein